MSDSSIGIIGGADGPTAIFVTSSLSIVSIITIAVVVAAVVVGIVVFLKRRKKQR